MSDFHELTVQDVIRETDDCVTVLFQVTEDKKKHFEFTPGQYLTIKKTINNEEVRRAYSICTGSRDDILGVSVKKVKNGKMSGYLNDSVQTGDVLEVMQPDGRFTLITNLDVQRDHYFFAAGSGITPVMSMIKSMLEDEPKSTAYLLYGSKDEDHIIFKEKFDRLLKEYEGQLVVKHTLSKPLKEKSGGLLGLLGKNKTLWKGLKGRIDSEKVVSFLKENPPKSSTREYYICGPGDMIETVRTTLLGNEVLDNQIHQEYFSSGSSENREAVESTSGAKLKVLLNGQEIQIVVNDGKTILDTLMDAGYEAPYSCTSGACSTCMAKVVKGETKMEACFALDDDEIKEGYILTCQAHPTSDEVEIVYE